jgi:DUF4097 and DUF4098 domain-containing protein YvlB
MRHAKALISLAVLGLFVLALGIAPACAGERDNEKYQEKFNKTESLAMDGKVSIIDISGDIKVKTWDKAEVQIDAVKTSRSSSVDKAKENAQKVTIEVTKSDKAVQIKVKYPEGRIRNLNVSVDFDLMIPAKASLESKTVSGDVTVEKIGGTLIAGSVSGDVTVLGAAKGVDAHTVSGDVKVHDVDGDAYVKTVSGDVEAERVSGSVNAETVSGNVTLNGISAAKTVNAKALSGDVTYSGAIGKDGHYSFKSHSGEVVVTIPADSAFEFTAKTFSGDISSDFKVEVQGRISKKELHGTVNGGGAILDLEAFSGDIELRKK